MSDRTPMPALPGAPPAGAPELLSTKLALPRPRPALVPRAALLARLDAGQAHPLTLVSAPAGFGKTTLVSTWVAARRPAAPPLPVAWVALDAGDNDPIRFWRYVVAACRPFLEAADPEAAAPLPLPPGTTGGPQALETLITALINRLAPLPGRAVLVLEDYHVIQAPRIHATLTFLLDHLPGTLHLLIITRSDPPLPLARLRARGDLCELHAADLRFSPAEARTFLQQTVPFPLSGEVVARLGARTEGWAAGLRLVALALQGPAAGPEVEAFLGAFTGGHRHILDYLGAEVLAAQPPAIQQFLLQTSVLPRLTGALCDAITGGDGGTPMLAEVERQNLFLTALDGAGEWYRYHTLFAEAMQHEARRRLGGAGLRVLAHKASRWYEAHSMLVEAVEAALAAEAFARAATLIEQLTPSPTAYQEVHTLRRWLDALPADVLDAHPALCLTLAVARLFSVDRRAPGTPALVDPPLQQAERAWRAAGDGPRLGTALAFRALALWWQGDFAGCRANAHEALALLPAEERYWRGISLISVGMEELLDGRPLAARATLAAARTCCATSGNSYAARAATFLLGEACARQGALHEAARLYRQVLAEAGEDLLDQGQAWIGLAALAYEWNDLATAEQQATRALDIGRQHAAALGHHQVTEALVVPGSLVLARVLQARGEPARARALLGDLVALTGEDGGLLHREVLAGQARLALAAGDLAAVQRWATTWAQSPDVPVLYQEREALLVARLLIRQGDSRGALRVLAPWQATAAAEGRAAGDLELHLLAALAHAAEGDLCAARQRLIPALLLAQPAGYTRLFLDEGAPLAALLRAVVPAGSPDLPAGHGQRLLLALAPGRPAPAALPGPTPAPSLDPLSPQEQRVLRLLAAGHTNPEIAQELIVSINTVKTQVKSIYRKLNVTRREDAGAAAHLLALG